jgi:hypothetical protein
LGYIAPDDPKLRARSALVGAGTGAVLGGLGGAIASSGLRPEEVSKAQDAAFRAGHSSGVEKGFQAGREAMVNHIPMGVPMTESIKEMLLKKIRGVV